MHRLESEGLIQRHELGRGLSTLWSTVRQPGDVKP
ncbi:FaeA/PapI family transcriptional regulator [Streptomyces werraensis]